MLLLAVALLEALTDGDEVEEALSDGELDDDLVTEGELEEDAVMEGDGLAVHGSRRMPPEKTGRPTRRRGRARAKEALTSLSVDDRACVITPSAVVARASQLATSGGREDRNNPLPIRLLGTSCVVLVNSTHVPPSSEGRICIE